MTLSASAVRHIIVGVLVAALVGSMLFLGADPATSAKINNKVGINVSDKTVKPKQKITFFGKVKSNKGKCRKNRQVILKRVGTGKVKQKKTDGDGEYRFKINPKPDKGKYFVQAKKKELKPSYGYYGYEEADVCKKAKSKKIKIKPKS